MRLLFIITSLFCSIVSLSVFFTFRAQRNLVYPKLATNKIESLNDFNKQFSYFPNITATAIPIQALRATFALNEGKFSLGDSLLDIAEKDNPYIGYSEYIKAKTYYALANIDSATFYAERAFKKWPKSIDNYTMYLKTLAFQGDTLAIVKAFDYIDDIFKDRTLYSDEFVNYYALAKVKFLISKYPDGKPIKAEDLKGRWIKCYEYEGGKIQYDSLTQITFDNNYMKSSSSNSYRYELNKDTLLLYSTKNNILITKSLLKYSESHNTLILTSDPRTKGVDQFFKKIIN
jgi:tetratricopeptide (TPR) repeat protein